MERERERGRDKQRKAERERGKKTKKVPSQQNEWRTNKQQILPREKPSQTFGFVGFLSLPPSHDLSFRL